MTQQAYAAVAQARDEFIALVDHIRPELHRYCARLTGSVIEGEDIVQDTLAKAFYAISMQPEVPPLRPWLFRIAHNAALDHLKRHGHRYTEPRAELDDRAEPGEAPDPYALRAALSRFLALTVSERSAVILKDVLGHSLEEVAETMDATIPAVKAALVRGRAKLREPAPEAAPAPAPGAPDPADAAARGQLDTYVRLFNARDWDGVRALVGEDCRLDVVARSQRRGKTVGFYFDRYGKEDVRLEIVQLEGRLALAALAGGETAPSYVILLDWEAGQIRSIRDFRYVPYILDDAALERP